MAEFTPITTQAEFDAAIADRLSRQEKGFMSAEDANKLRGDYDKQIAGLNQQLTAANSAKEASDKQLTEALSKIRGYETDSAKTRIALEMGLPYGMAGRLAGDTEDAIRKDAEALKALIGNRSAAPLANPEPESGNADSSALKTLLRQMRNQ